MDTSTDNNKTVKLKEILATIAKNTKQPLLKKKPLSPASKKNKKAGKKDTG